jgi:integral membrane protein (TIGR01906 family)
VSITGAGSRPGTERPAASSERRPGIGTRVAASSGRPPGIGRRLASVAVAIATAVVITGASIALFFNPLWVSFDQGRANAAAYTGWTPGQVDTVTRDIVMEVWLGPGTFTQEVAGEPVFAARERSHMADVRGIVLAFYAFVALAAATLFVSGAASRRARWFWRAVAFGARGLAIGAVVVGAAFLVFFDTAFTLFHELFFAAGTWSFDPATDRLVQLFPYQFWTETSVAIAVVGLGLTIGVWAAARRWARPAETPAGQDPVPTPVES